MSFVNTQGWDQVLVLPYTGQRNFSKSLGFYDFHFPTCQIENNCKLLGGFIEVINVLCIPINLKIFHNPLLCPWLPTLHRIDPSPLESDLQRAIALKSQCLNLNPEFKVSWPYDSVLISQAFMRINEEQAEVRNLVQN